MRSLKGLGLLITSTFLVFLTLVISGNILINFILPMIGIDLRGTVATYHFAFAALFGFGGALISLFMSKTLAKRMYRMQQVSTPSTPKEKLVYETVKELAEREGIKMPEVWVYWDDTPNAFATGPTRNNAMVAVSSGLALNMNDHELKAVLAHEVGHIANGDMIATTMLQGLMNTFVYFLAGMIARVVASAGSRDGEMNYALYFIVDMLLQVVFSILAMIVVSWHSRHREFKADAYAADAYGADSMVAALAKLQAISQPVEHAGLANEDALATMKIFGGFSGLFATHPPIEVRIEALRNRG